MYFFYIYIYLSLYLSLYIYIYISYISLYYSMYVYIYTQRSTGSYFKSRFLFSPQIDEGIVLFYYMCTMELRRKVRTGS